MLFNNPTLWSSCTQNRIFTGFRSMYWAIIVRLFHADGNSWNLDESVYDSYLPVANYMRQPTKTVLLQRYIG